MLVLLATMSFVLFVTPVAVSAAAIQPDFTASCSQTNTTTIVCTAIDNDGASTTGGTGHENGAFVVFYPTGAGASYVSSSSNYCAWTSTAATQASTPANCVYSGTWDSSGGVGGQSLSNTGGAVFTVAPGGVGESISFVAMDCTGGAPSTSSSTPCSGPKSNSNNDGSDCSALGVAPKNSQDVCATTTFSIVTPEFPLGSVLAVIAPLGALGLYFGVAAKRGLGLS